MNTTIDQTASPTLERRIEDAEKELRARSAALLQLRKQLPSREVEDCTLTRDDGSPVKLSELFGDKPDLMLIFNMGTGCKYCTLWADGFNGMAHHLQDRAAFAVVSGDGPETQAKFKRSRGWTFAMVSSRGTSFAAAEGFQASGEANESGARPGVATYRKSPDGKILRVASAGFGPGDEYCSTWHLFDLLDGGARDWAPKYEY